MDLPAAEQRAGLSRPLLPEAEPCVEFCKKTGDVAFPERQVLHTPRSRNRRRHPSAWTQRPARWRLLLGESACEGHGHRRWNLPGTPAPFLSLGSVTPGLCFRCVSFVPRQR